MAKERNDYSSYSNEELERRVALYQSKSGHLDIGKIHVPQSADTFFIVLLVVVAAIFFADWGVLNMMGMAWTEGHLLSLLALEAYPLIITSIVGLYVIGHRCEEIALYFRFKRVLKDRSTTLTEATA